MKITDIKTQVKNPNKTSIYIDGKYSFALTIDQLADQKDIRIGKEIAVERVEEMEALHIQTNLYLRMVNLCMIRPRSEFEIRSRIWQVMKSKLGVGQADDLVQKLQAKGYLNDERFANWWVEGRKNSKRGYSRRKLQSELAKKGIKADMAKQVLEYSFSNDAELSSLRNLVIKKKDKYTDQQKLIAFLAGRGFGYGIIKQVLAEQEGGEDESANW